MRELQLRLDSIELALRELPGKLRLESEVTLGIPDEWLIDVTPAMISCTVAAGELWVERASPCRLHIDPVVSSGLATIADDSSHERRLVNAVRTCSVSILETFRQAVLLYTRLISSGGLGASGFAAEPLSQACG